MTAEDEAKCKAAVDFRKEFDAENELPYDWVYDYAKDKYEKSLEAFAQLDEKADAIIRYLGGGTTIITLGALIGASRANAFLIFLTLPSIFLALWAIAYAVQARQPTEVPVPPRVDETLIYVEAYRERGKHTFIAQWHEACERLDVVVATKARNIGNANKFYLRALLCLLIPVLIWPFWKLLDKTEPTKVDITSPPLKIQLTSPPTELKISPSSAGPSQ